MACSKTQDGVSRPFSILGSVVAQCLIAVSLLACNQTPETTLSAVQSGGVVTIPATIDTALLDSSFDAPFAGSRSASRPFGPACPFPQHVRHVPGTTLPDHRDRAQLDSDVVAAYVDWKQDHLVKVGLGNTWPPLYRVAFSADQPDRTVSEGIGYGMLITVLMAGEDPLAQEYFDGLWRFARLHPSSIDARMTAWQIPESSNGDAAAFDGDADIALALLMADKQWGSDGDIDYRHEAAVSIAALYESSIGPDSYLPLLGDWVDPHGEQHNQFTPRSSDFMPASFRAFAAAMPNENWARVLASVLDVVAYMQSTHAPETALLPDFLAYGPGDDGVMAFRPAAAGFLEGPHDGDYHYNAGRLPLRLGMDGLLHGGQSLELLRNVAAFASEVTTAGVKQMGAGYRLDGTVTGNYFTTFFAAPFAVALMSEPRYQQRLNSLYDAIYQRREGYYEDSINLLSLLLLTGNFWSMDQACTA